MDQSNWAIVQPWLLLVTRRALNRKDQLIVHMQCLPGMSCFGCLRAWSMVLGPGRQSVMESIIAKRRCIFFQATAWGSAGKSHKGHKLYITSMADGPYGIRSPYCNNSKGYMLPIMLRGGNHQKDWYTTNCNVNEGYLCLYRGFLERWSKRLERHCKDIEALLPKEDFGGMQPWPHSQSSLVPTRQRCFWILLMHLPFQQSKTFSPVKHFQLWWWKWEVWPVWPGLKHVKVQIVMMPLPWLEDHWMWACDWIFPWFPCLQPSLTDASPNWLGSFGSTDFKAPVTCWNIPKEGIAGTDPSSCR